MKTNGQVETERITNSFRRFLSFSTIAITMALNMNAAAVSANENVPWYVNFDPVFERTYSAFSDGKLVSQTESIDSDQVNQILDDAFSRQKVREAILAYVEYTNGNEAGKSDSADANLYNAISDHFVQFLSEYEPASQIFFSKSLTLASLQQAQTRLEMK